MKLALALALLTCALLATPGHGKPAEPPKSSEVFDVTDLDGPPQPVKRAAASHPRHLLGTSGAALVQFTVDAKGKPRDIEIVSADHKDFGAAAVDCVKQWRFKPALKDGRPVKCRMRLPIVFRARAR